MNVITVDQKRTTRLFHKAARRINRHQPNWVCPLDKEIESIFQPNTNQSFKNGVAQRWVLEEHGELIGRIAAFVDYEKCYKKDVPTGGIGFFECIDDQHTGDTLFDTAMEWLQARGMEAMEGPVNFGENDNWWGLLVKGFEYKPVMGMQYHPPYYRTLFENYGFKVYFEQYSYQLNFKEDFPDRFWNIAEWVFRKGRFTFDHFRRNQKQKYLQQVVEIYNNTWPTFKRDFTPMDYGEMALLYDKISDVVEERFCWFAYDNGRPVAMVLMFPDVNQILSHIRGKLTILQKLKCWWLMKRKTITNARILIMGVDPRHQRSGLESAIFWHLNEVLKEMPHYKTVELAWVGDFNPRMKKLYELVGGRFFKQHNTYIYAFDPNVQLKPYREETAMRELEHA
jgi:GNAT superfamily N-acetyltransferase